MARWNPAPVIGGAYSDDAKAWSDQDTVNWIPVVAERGGSRTPTMLRDAPGLIVISDLGTNAPIRGTHNVEGLLLAVSGNKLFKIGVDGGGTEIGTIPGVERVSMAHNQITGGNEVAIANGQSGYVYNTVTETLTQITDDGFPGAISFDFCDSYIMGIEPGRRFGFHSQLAAAGDYNTLDRYEAEGSPDKLVGQIVTHREWWLFGERTIEPYVNTGAATGTFQRSGGTVMQKGLASRWAVAQIDNSVMWLGSDGVVYRAEGYNPVRKSTHAIEQAIARCNIAQAFAFVFDDRGHQIFYLTFPDGQTWGYDAASGEWHRRQSYGLDRWRINTLTKWRNAWIAGDYSNGRIYQLDWNTSNEAGDILERRRITGVLSDNHNPVIVNGVALEFDTGASGSSSGRLISPLAISGSLPQGVVNEAADFTYTLSGGVLARSVSIQSGALPTGLSMDSAGHVTGIFSDYGTFSWVALVEDAIGTIATISQTMTVFAKIIADIDFDTGSLTYDKTGRTWTIDSGSALWHQSNTPVAEPTIVTSVAGSGLAMSKCPDIAGYWGEENLGIRTLLGADAIGPGVDFCIELSVASIVNYDLIGNISQSFITFYSGSGRMTFGARFNPPSIPMENTVLPSGLTNALWNPPNLSLGVPFHFAVVREGDVLSCWQGPTAESMTKYAEYTGASGLDLRSTDAIVVGHGGGGISTTKGWPGQFDNVKITRGWARYT
jgi:hypothetical protein